MKRKDGKPKAQKPRVNIRGQRFGCLEALYPAKRDRHGAWVWRFICRCRGECGQQHESRRGCAATRDMRAYVALDAETRGYTLFCKSCSALAHPKGGFAHYGDVTRRNVRAVLARFTDRQRRRFVDVLGGRTTAGEEGVENVIGAAVVVLREPASGACCMLCERGELESLRGRAAA